MVRPATAADLPVLAAIHGQAFPHDPWDEAMLARLMDMAGAFALVTDGGFVLPRVAADEMEIVTIAVAPAGRRRGLGCALLQAGLGQARDRGAVIAFLEVAADNHGAIALYRQAGFAETGRRRGYYRRPGTNAADAIVMACRLDDLDKLSPPK